MTTRSGYKPTQHGLPHVELVGDGCLGCCGQVRDELEGALCVKVAVHAAADGIQEALEDCPSSILCSRRKDLYCVCTCGEWRKREEGMIMHE